MMALVFAMVMLVAMSVSTFAAKITMDTKEGHTYEIYQVFTGTVDADGKTLTEVKYGTNAKGTTGEYVSAADLATLKSLESLTDEHQIIAAYSEFLNFTNPIEVAQGDTTTDLDPGYYVIRDKNDTVPADKPNDDITLYMFKVLKDDISVSAKSGTVESEKHVDDINDSTGDESKLKDSADYEIGDTIPYTLTFELPEDYAKYEKYYVKFSDDMSAGLTLNADSVKIKYGSADATAITFTNGGAGSVGTLYTYEIADLKTAAPAMKAGDVITITYTAYLNDSAVIGSTGNPNEYTVKFNNNPNQSGNGKDSPTGDTPKDKNIVFTYKTVFNKVDENGTALKGADFILQKKVNGEWVDVTTLGTSVHPKKIGSSAQESTTFEFQGLDDGEYKLIESFTPSGYNKLADVTFTITASHDLESDNPQLKDLLANGLTMEKDVAAGSLTTSIVNKSGAVLPSTGGIGTTIFYVVGAVLVLGAATLLVAKRRVER